MAPLTLLFGVEGVLLGPLLRFLMQSLDVGLELRSVYSPNTAASYLDRGKASGSHERIDLRPTHIQQLGHVLVVLMTSALVVAVWGVARERLVDIVSTSLETVCGSIGC